MGPDRAQLDYPPLTLYAAELSARIREIRKFGNQGKCSIIENVAPDPGSCICVNSRLHAGPDFLL
jgi:hypothetical protein